MKKKILYSIIIIFLSLYLITILYHQFKPLPENISYESEIYNIPESEIKFLYDLTYINHNNEKVFDHEIFSEIFSLIDNAEEFILIDMFLFNNDYSQKNFNRNITQEMTEKLIKKKQENPEIEIIFITDKLNTFYDSYTPSHLENLSSNGIKVVYTDMHQLRDSNFFYSGVWRLLFQPFGNSRNGWIEHPLGNQEHEVTIRSILNVFNAKANHRKVIVADNNDKYSTIITSANPHTPSSDHSNVALLINNSVSKDVLISESSIIDFSSNYTVNLPQINSENEGNIKVQYLSEKKILDNIIQDIENTNSNDTIYINMFYFSERNIVSAIKDASDRNVTINIVLDPNKDAFAREKSGIPNRQVAYELNKKDNVDIYWFNTKGEQYHSKMIVIQKGNQTIINLGSSNYTKRNLLNYNLESNVRVIAPINSTISNNVLEYVNRILENEGGTYILDYSEFEDDSKIKYMFYRFQEFTGMGTY